MFTGEAQIERLQRSLVKWMDRFCSGIYDEAYYAETLKIGRVHVEVGLPQRYMFTAMALIRVALHDIADEHLGADARATRRSITRLIDMELAAMLQGYNEHTIARLQRADRLENEALSRTLQRTEHRYVRAVELARALVVGLDARGVVRLFNREAERVTGYGREEVIGESFVDRLVPPDLASTHGDMLLGRAAGRSGDDVIESVVRTRSGNHREVRWQIAYAPSETDDEVVLFVVGQDITEENAREERTRQTERLAAVGTLAAGLAHEIRNPLNGAQLHLAFLERALKRAKGNDELLEAVSVVGDEIKRLAALVSEFLDFARPKPLTVRPVSAEALCMRVVPLVAARAEAARVKVVTDFPTRDPKLRADAGKIEQVLLNLLSNAIEAMEPQGGGTLTLRVRRAPRNATLEIEDTGPGLSDPAAPIFDPFFSTKPQGTGLGLAITHRIVTDHGGDITVESVPGRTVFRVQLPIDIE